MAACSVPTVAARPPLCAHPKVSAERTRGGVAAFRWRQPPQISGHCRQHQPPRLLHSLPNASAAEGPVSSTSGLSEEQIETEFKRAVSLISTYDRLAPFDPAGYNPAVLLWKHIKALPPDVRLQLLDKLDFRDISKLWNLSQRLVQAAPDQLTVAMGSDYSIWDEFPDDPGEVAVFDGKASVPVAGLVGLDRFQKAFFVHPRTFNLMGRVLLNRGAVGDMLYPLYYQADVHRQTIPSTGEICDISLEYLDPEELPLGHPDLPDQSWPAPGSHRFPFNGGLVDYMRPVGPGVFVGCGWKEKLDTGLISERFLTFILVRNPHPDKPIDA